MPVNNAVLVHWKILKALKGFTIFLLCRIVLILIPHYMLYYQTILMHMPSH